MDIEDKLIIAKLHDKVTISKTRNKMVNTEFLSLYKKELIQKELNKMKFKNYFFFGGYEDAEGEILFIYPEKLGLEIAKKEIENVIKVIRIKLPKELKNKYSHKDYLGAVMQTGLNRDRIGDIIVHEDMAYIIVLRENVEYIKNFLKDLNRFSKSEIEILNYFELEIKEPEFDDIKISVASIRIDCIVSEIARVSRKKAEEMLEGEKIFINAKCETKTARNLNERDVLAIRGVGKFIISEIIGKNKKGKIIVIVKKYK